MNTASTLTFDTKMAGSSKEVTPSAMTIKDASDADMTANYNITYTKNSSSVISQKAITVTAPEVTKTYDGTTAASGSATYSALVSGDVMNTASTLTFDTKMAGSSKDVTPSAMTIKDGSDADMTANYNITYTKNSTSVISQNCLLYTSDAADE